jgi:hypothetical protein
MGVDVFGVGGRLNLAVRDNPDDVALANQNARMRSDTQIARIE